MKSTLGKLWKLGITPIGELSAETVKSGVDVANKVFKLAETLEKEGKNNEQIKQLVDQIPTLLEALNSPWGQVVKSTIPFLGIGASLLQFTLDATKKEPTLAQSVSLVAQSAYLESLRDTIKGETELLEKLEESASEATQQQIRNLAELELSDGEARLALVYFPQSKLAEAFNNAVISRIEESGLAKAEAKNRAERIAANTPQYIEVALVNAGESAKPLLEWVKAGGRETFEKYLSIDTYLQDEILTLPYENVFKEKFTFDDIYVPLKAAPLDKNGEEILKEDNEKPLLETWTKDVLEDKEKQQQVLFIQAAAGRGKSVFCRMFAAWVAENLHPRLTPILIRLRDIEVFEQSFEETLTKAVHWNFAKDDWLNDRNTRFLFILDGFDELRMEGRQAGGVERFILQAGKFQEYSQKNNAEMGHRVIITGRPLALQGIPYLPDNLERVKLLKMDDELRQQWLTKWQNVVFKNDPQAATQETQAFRGFLEDEKCPEAVKDELAREPLLLYLLARMHKGYKYKDQEKDEEIEIKITIGDLQESSATEAKIIIYEKCLQGVLREQREEGLQKQITGLDTATLERILTEAGLCVVQSGGEFAKVKMIESRLETSDSEATQLIKDLRQQQGEKALTTALGAFYLRPAAGDKGGGVEFYHKSFGEFLCAKRLQDSLEEWKELRQKKRQQFVIKDEELWKDIYDLLGYGGLTPEIVEYLMGLLERSEAFNPVKLFERLNDFYWRWCDGEFIDADGTTLPQWKMRQLKAQLPEQVSYLGQRQVDVYAGLNVMILLLELHRYAKEKEGLDIQFYPSGQVNEQGNLKDPRLLFRLMGYSECLGNDGFLKVMGRFLRGANLGGANLGGANLRSASLRSASLRGAGFRSADLRGADLQYADLRGADLRSASLRSASLRGAGFRSASLRGADLQYADLRDADLLAADLSGADLSGANLKYANLKHANLRGGVDKIIWDKTTKWENVRRLETARNIPEVLKQQLGLE